MGIYPINKYIFELILRLIEILQTSDRFLIYKQRKHLPCPAPVKKIPETMSI